MVEAKTVSVQEHFANVAALYEEGTGGSTRRIAGHLVELASPIKSHASILDNACGTGILIDELLATISDVSCRDTLVITAADAAQPMLDQLSTKVKTKWQLPGDHLKAVNLAAEDLDSIPADSFDCSFTNFGFQFFKDPQKAAAQVYRTLKPGGKAFITAWNDLGYFKAVEQSAATIRPTQPPPRLPISAEWFEAHYLREVLETAPFRDVKLHEKESRFSAASTSELAERLLLTMGTMLKLQGWTDNEVERLPLKLKEFFDRNPENLEVGETGCVLK